MAIGKRFYEHRWDESDGTIENNWRRVINGKDHLFRRVLWSDGHYSLRVDIAHYHPTNPKKVDYYEYKRTFICCEWLREAINKECAEDGVEPLPDY